MTPRNSSADEWRAAVEGLRKEIEGKYATREKLDDAIKNIDGRLGIFLVVIKWLSGLGGLGLLVKLLTSLKP